MIRSGCLCGMDTDVVAELVELVDQASGVPGLGVWVVLWCAAARLPARIAAYHIPAHIAERYQAEAGR